MPETWRSRATAYGLVGIAAVVFATSTCVQIVPLLFVPGTAGLLMDETQNVQVALNFLTHLHYSLDLTKPHAGAFYPEGTTGLLSSAPAAIGWGLGGDLLSARVTVALYCLSLAVALAYLFFRSLSAPMPVAIALGLLACSALLFVTPGAPQAIVQTLGEFSGAVWLGLGYLLLPVHPRAGALLLGLCVWHTKFIYLPFALLGLAWSSLLHRTTALGRVRVFMTDLGLMIVPLVVWMVIIWIMIGQDGFAEWLARRLYWYRAGHSGLTGPPTVRGLWSRLASSRLEWSGYSVATQLKVLTFLFLPCAALVADTARCWHDRRLRLPTAVLQLGTCAIILAFAWWYFFWHQFMWLRHLLPPLFVGEVALICFAARPLIRLPPRRQAALVVVIAAGLVVANLEAYRRQAYSEPPSARAARFARDCRSDKPWQTGPWSWCAGLGHRASTLVP